MTARWIRCVTVLVAASTLLAACDGDGDDAADPADGDPTEQTDPPPTDGADEPDAGGEGDEETVAVAEAALLTEGDFPEGWTGEASDGDDGEIFRAAQGIDACGPLNEFAAQMDTAVASADSADFFDASGNLAGNEVEVFADASTAADALGLLAATDPEACIAEALRTLIAESENLPEGSELGEPEVAAAPALDVAGDASTGFRVTLPLRTGAGEVDLAVDLYAVQVGPAVIRYTFLGIGAPLAVGPDLVEASAARTEGFV